MEKKDGEIVFTKYSPYMVVDCEVVNEEGTKVETAAVTSLCRCGASKMKPYCDGSHGQVNFVGQAEERDRKIVMNYKGEGITIHFNPYLCRHSARCVDNLPQVFDTSKKPWVTATAASKEDIIKVIKSCPSGALTYTEGEKHCCAWHNKQRVVVIKDGPLDCEGSIKLKDDQDSLSHLASDDHYSLCRCGESKRRPFCDGTHHDIEFKG